jgi:VanZ family protein
MLMIVLRGGAVLALLILFVAMLGPFQGAEQNIGLNDKAAHAIGFFIITGCLTLIAPGLGPWRTALLAIGLGAGVEVAQGLSGRSANLFDLGADGVGVILATLMRAGVDRMLPEFLAAR